MKKYLIIISLTTLLLTVFTFSGCANEVLDNKDLSAESSSQIVKTFEVMSITPEEVYRIISEGKDIFLLDVRTEEEYTQGYIKGANVIPVQELEIRLNEIPVGKQIIIYCKSGVRSRTAADILIENGFGLVYDMGGIDDWQEKGYPVMVEKETDAEFEEITVDEAFQIFNGDKDYLFIDVRSEDEYNSGHIEGAINIPVSEIDSRLNEIPKDKLIIVYCNGSSCNRSNTAANILIENGYSQVYNIGGNGIFEWIEKGYPVTDV